MLTLITGGARSGKSRFAQKLCESAQTVTYIATARAEDDEMRERISKHRQSRPGSWTTVEEALALPEAVHAARAETVLVDCITVWLSNLCFEWRDASDGELERNVRQQVARLIDASGKRTIVAVSNEVGFGIVPESQVARRFRDIQGFVNQQIAEAASAVYLVVSGIPLRIKPPSGDVTTASLPNRIREE